MLQAYTPYINELVITANVCYAAALILGLLSVSFLTTSLPIY